MPHKNLLVAGAALLGACAAICPAQAGSFTYTLITSAIEGVGGTATGLNDKDQVVGQFVTTNLGARTKSKVVTEGFYWPAGQITYVQANGAYASQLYAINDNGLAAGDYELANNGIWGTFTLDTVTGQQQIIAPPKGTTFYFPRGINNSGQICGDSGIKGEGFFWNGTALQYLKPKTHTLGIDDAAEILLSRKRGEVGLPYLYSAGKYREIDVPGAQLVNATFIAPSGTVGGVYVDSNGKADLGFTWVGGTITAYEYPKAVATYVTGLGPDNEVFGTALIGGSTLQAYLALSGTYYPLDIPGYQNTSIIAANSTGSFLAVAYGSDPNGPLDYYLAQCPAADFPCTH